MISQHLNYLPTTQRLYDRLTAIPSFIQMQPLNGNGSKSFCGYSATPYHPGSDTVPNGLMSFVDGTFILSSVFDPNNKDRPFIWTTFQGDNLFTIKTEMLVEDGIVTVTTHLTSGSENDLFLSANEISDDSNSTVVRQQFIQMGNNNEAKLVKSEILSTGYGKTGASIPTYADANIFAAGLERLYATSDFVKLATPNQMTASTDVDNTNLGAFWNSWGDAIQAATTVAGGVAGGVVGIAGGPVGILSGASAGASIGNLAAGALIPDSAY